MTQPQVEHSSGTTTFLIALGANLASRHGAPATALRAAIPRLEAQSFTIQRLGHMYLTPCIPQGAGPDYVNTAAAIVSDCDLDTCLARLHAVEAEFDRARTNRWGARTLDLDLLAMGDTVRPDYQTFKRWKDLTRAEQLRRTPDELILPHPRLHERAFVLLPLCDVAHDWQHPVLGRSVAEMAEALSADDTAGIRDLGPM